MASYRSTQCQALAQMLTVNLNITHVYLGGNQIGDAGTEAVLPATGMCHLFCLMSFHCQALAQMLKQNRSITNINLHANQIGSDGIQAMLSCCLPENGRFPVS